MEGLFSRDQIEKIFSFVRRGGYLVVMYYHVLLFSVIYNFSFLYI